jgi:hypothetical protein
MLVAWGVAKYKLENKGIIKTKEIDFDKTEKYCYIVKYNPILLHIRTKRVDETIGRLWIYSQL